MGLEEEEEDAYRKGEQGRCGGRIGSNRRTKFNDIGNPSRDIDRIEHKFYEVAFCNKFKPEQKSRVRELRANRNESPPSSQNVSSVEIRFQQLEQSALNIARAATSTQIVPVRHNIMQVVNANNPALQRLNQRS